VDLSILTQTAPWAIAAARFTNPMYLSAPLDRTNNGDTAGFDISAAAAVLIAFQGTYTGVTLAHEQTLDLSGADGWFSVEGAPTDGSSATSAGATVDLCYVFPCIGVRHRIRVTALATGTLEARVRLDAATLSSSSAGGGGGGSTDITEWGGEAVTGGAGAVAAGTPRMTLASDDPAVVALQAIQSSTATGNVAPDTAVIYNGATALTPKFATISASSSGDNTLVAAVPSKRIRVTSYLLSASAAVNGKFQSETAGDISGLHYWASAGQGATPAYDPTGIIQTVAGEALQLNLSGAVPVGGWLKYIEV
jgi:hypothetical protein